MKKQVRTAVKQPQRSEPATYLRQRFSVMIAHVLSAIFIIEASAARTAE